MRLSRLILALAALTVLGSLLVWQRQRHALVEACTVQGGFWDGAQSRCRLIPNRIFIESDLKRT